MRLLASISIKWQIGGIILFLGLLLLCLSAQRAVEAVAHETASRRVVALSMTSRELLKLTFAARSERGDYLYALLGDAPVKPASRQAIDERRAQTETDYAASLALLDKLGLPELTAPLVEFRRNYDAMAALRPVIDRAVMLPLGQRDPALAERWPKAADSYFTALTAVSAVIDSAIALHDPRIDRLLTAKRAAEAGQIHWTGFSTIVSRSVATGTSWRPADIRQAAENWGRTLNDWDFVAKIAANADAPDGVKAAVAAARDALFDKEAALREPLVDRLVAGDKPGIGIDEWRPHALASSRWFGTVATAALADLVAIARAQADASFFRLLAACGVLILALVSVCVGWAVVSRRVTAPMLSLAQVMRRLAERDFAVPVPSAQRADELGVMARAVEAFRENGVTMRAWRQKAPSSADWPRSNAPPKPQRTRRWRPSRRWWWMRWDEASSGWRRVTSPVGSTRILPPAMTVCGLISTPPWKGCGRR